MSHRLVLTRILADEVIALAKQELAKAGIPPDFWSSIPEGAYAWDDLRGQHWLDQIVDPFYLSNMLGDIEHKLLVEAIRVHVEHEFQMEAAHLEMAREREEEQS